MIPVQEIDNIKVYGKDVNPFKLLDEKKKELTGARFVSRDGRSIEEIERLSRIRRKRKYELTEEGTYRAVPIIGKHAKKSKAATGFETTEESEKGFAGGFVMEPKPGFYENIPILDFNALYPNIMMSYCLDPSLLVLDKRFANCPGVRYLRIRFNKQKEFLFAQGFPGVMIKHTRQLVDNRKIAQAIQGNYSSRVESTRERLATILGLDVKTKMDDVLKSGNEYVARNKDDRKSIDVQLATSTYEWLLSSELSIMEKLLKDAGAIPKSQAFDRDVVLEAVKKHLEGKDEKLARCLAVCLKVKQAYEDKLAEWKSSEPSKADMMTCDKLLLIVMMLGMSMSYTADVTNYNSKQNELKVGSNSTFGFLGAGGRIEFSDANGRIVRKGMMQVMPVSACVTYIGRKTIESAKEWVERTYPGAIVIYADTDSLFIFFPETMIPKGIEGLNATFPLAQEAAAGITKLFSFPGSSMRIVHEKSARFLIMYSAKCYALDKYEHPYPQDIGKLEVKGLSFSKRDCCKFVSALCKTSLNKILKQGKLEEAKQFVRDSSMDFVNDRIRQDEIANIKDKLSDLVQPFVPPDDFKSIRKKISDIATAASESMDDIADIILRELSNIVQLDNRKQINDQLCEFVKDKIRMEKVGLFKKLSKKAYGKEEEGQSGKMEEFVTYGPQTTKLMQAKGGGNIAAHAVLAQKIDQRKPGLGPKSGESVHYVFIDLGTDATEKKNQKVFKKNYVKCGEGYIEDYEYVLENNLKVDKLWYLENQCTKSITTLFSPLMNDPSSLLKDSICEQKRRQFGMKKNTDIFSKMEQFGMLSARASSGPCDDEII